MSTAIALTYTSSTQPAHGTLSGTAPNLTYTPAANYNGPDSFTFRANDGTVDCDAATVSITVNAVNDAPVADRPVGDHRRRHAEGDHPGRHRRRRRCAHLHDRRRSPAHGTLSGTAPNLTYTPAANYNGAGQLHLQGQRRHGRLERWPPCRSRSTPVNDAPVATGQTVTHRRGHAPRRSRWPATDVDGDPLTYTSSHAPPTARSAARRRILTYTPAANYNGPDSFTFKANDGTARLERRPRSRSPSTGQRRAGGRRPVGDAPHEDTRQGDHAGRHRCRRRSADLHRSSTQPAARHAQRHGAESDLHPAANYNGPDSFTFRANDGTVDSQPATVVDHRQPGQRRAGGRPASRSRTDEDTPRRSR